MYNDNEYSNDSYRSYTSQLDLLPSSQIVNQTSSILRKNNDDKNSNKLKKKQLKIYLVIEQDVLDNMQLADIIYKEFIFSASLIDNYNNDDIQIYTDNSNKYEFHIQSISKLTRYHNKNTFIRWTRYSNISETYSYENINNIDDSNSGNSNNNIKNNAIYEPFLLHIIECDMFIDYVLKSKDGIEFIDLFNYIQQHHLQYLLGFSDSNNNNNNQDDYNMLVNMHRIIVFIGLDKSIRKEQQKVL